MYANYVKQNIEVGMTVRCCKSYSDVQEGDIGKVLKVKYFIKSYIDNFVLQQFYVTSFMFHDFSASAMRGNFSEKGQKMERAKY